MRQNPRVFIPGGYIAAIQFVSVNQRQFVLSQFPQHSRIIEQLCSDRVAYSVFEIVWFRAWMFGAHVAPDLFRFCPEKASQLISLGATNLQPKPIGFDAVEFAVDGRYRRIREIGQPSA